MDQDLQPIVCRKANGVFRFGDGLHRAIHRAAEQPIGRLDGDAFAQDVYKRQGVTVASRLL